MARLHSKRGPMHEINVVPYVDVMLVLLVIFMVTAPLVTPGVIDLPSVGQAGQPKIAPLEIVIREDRSLALRARDAFGEERRVDDAFPPVPHSGNDLRFRAVGGNGQHFPRGGADLHRVARPGVTLHLLHGAGKNPRVAAPEGLFAARLQY